MSIHQTMGINPDAVLWSADEHARADRPLLVMMHGWSYDETHLFRLTPHLPPEVVIASVRARTPEAGGYAWFPSAGNPIGNPRPQVANTAVHEVMTWLDTLPTPSSIGLLGFSQGGAMALQLMRHAPGRFAYAVNLAGFVVADVQPGDHELARSRPPVFWGRGENDGIIPPAALLRTSDWLAEHATADIRVYPRLGHDVAGQEVRDLAGFIAAQI
jgi:phospholipase/carboxylesterase